MSPESNKGEPDVSQVKQALIALRNARTKIDRLEAQLTEPIAIIGIGLRLPGNICSVERLWSAMRHGLDLTRPIPADRWDVDIQSFRCLQDCFTGKWCNSLTVDESITHDDVGVKISSRKISKYWLTALGISRPKAHRLVCPIRWRS